MTRLYILRNDQFEQIFGQNIVCIFYLAVVPFSLHTDHNLLIPCPSTLVIHSYTDCLEEDICVSFGETELTRVPRFKGRSRLYRTGHATLHFFINYIAKVDYKDFEEVNPYV